MQFPLLTLRQSVPSSISQLCMRVCWKSKRSISTSLQLRHFDMLVVPKYCSQADGYWAHKTICRLSRSDTRLEAHPVPVPIHRIKPVATCWHSALWSGYIISGLVNKNMCAVVCTAFYMSGSSWSYYNFSLLCALLLGRLKIQRELGRPSRRWEYKTRIKIVLENVFWLK